MDRYRDGIYVYHKKYPALDKWYWEVRLVWTQPKESQTTPDCGFLLGIVDTEEEVESLIKRFRRHAKIRVFGENYNEGWPCGNCRYFNYSLNNCHKWKREDVGDSWDDVEICSAHVPLIV